MPLPDLPEMTTKASINYDFQQILDWIEDGDRLIINNRYQRGEIGQYKPAFRTRLIESIIRGFPMPSLLVMEKPTGQPDELIDGQQRLRTVEAFMNGNFALDGKHLLLLNAEDYHKVKWSDLDADHKERIRRKYAVKIDYIDDSMPAWKVYVLINSGQNPLNKCELRKAMFTEEEGYWIVDESAKDKFWTRYFTAGGLKREKGTEWLFKAIISMVYGKEDIVPEAQNRWLEEGMTKLFSDYDVPALKRLLNTFKNNMSTTNEIFTMYPFQKVDYSKVKTCVNKPKTKTSNPIVPMIAYMMHTLIKKYGKKNLVSNAALVRQTFYDYCNSDDAGFSGYFGMNGRDVLRRNEQLMACMETALTPIMSSPKRGHKDKITPILRQQVLDSHQNPDGDILCELCGEEHKDESLITMDHIVPWSEGGPTELINLQPAHRACNSAKGNKLDE